MKLIIKILGMLAAALMCGTVLAATLVESKTAESKSITYIEGTKMRVDDSTESGYMVMDLAKREAFLVNPQERTVMDLSGMTWQDKSDNASIPEVDARLERIGPGPEIAGYATEHYRLTADGEDCQDLYFSKKAFDETELDDFWAKAGKAFKEINVYMDDPCDIAETTELDPAKYGWSLKTVHLEYMHEGQFDEVVRIEKDAALPEGAFEMPADYQVVDMAAMMSGLGNGGEGAAGMTMDDSDWADEEDYDDSWDEEDYDEEEAYDEEEEAEDALTDSLKGLMDRFKKGGDDGN